MSQEDTARPVTYEDIEWIVSGRGMKVWVASFRYKHGQDLYAFSTEERAWKWADDIGNAWWDTEFDDPVPEENVGKMYFERMAEKEEFFEVQECTVNNSYYLRD